MSSDHASCCSHDKSAETNAVPDGKAIDPVCGMTVDVATAKHSTEHDGATHYFCSARCREKFVGDPDAYLKATDPVCGMTVTKATAKHTAVHEGTTYYFCNPKCLEKFTADPGKYLADVRPEEPVIEGAIYTCPMDPEIQQIGPGTCPICGMALEADTATADAGPSPNWTT